MSLLNSDEVRAAAIAQVQKLRDMYGARIPRDALSEGVTIRGQRIPIWNYQKGIFKPAVLGRGGAALSVQTSADSPYGDVHDIDAGRIVYKYRGTDPNHPDNVALRAAFVLQVPIIYLVAVDPGVYDVLVPVYVESDDPGHLQFTLLADLQSAIQGSTEPIQAALRREYATRAALQRLHQHQFRRVVLAAYKEQCCICRLKHVELLDAAHILSDKHPQGEPVVTNGLGLCKIHHSAFDEYIIGIDPDCRVHVRQDILHEIDGPMLKHGLQETSGIQITLPYRKADRPNRDFLAERFDRFKAA